MKGREDWDGYFTFSFVRNPWAQFLSFYYFKKTGVHKPPLTEFLKMSYDELSKMHNTPRNWAESKRTGIYRNQISQLSDDDDNVIVDFIGRFENLQEDFDKVCERINIPQRTLPHRNKREYKHKPYWEYYDDESIEIIRNLYKKDIEYFGYEFGK